jgi:hypothetical protein
MAKAWGAVLFIIFLIGNLYANVVINELLYDPAGTDTGYEWLELYNNGNSDIDLEGSQIQTAGTSFTTVFTFPHYILRAHRFVLIGEQYITQAVFITNLAMQNGDGATDGVRFVSADGDYSDTALYGNPNSNLLPDDTNNVGNSFAEDVTPGFSLARKADGYDTNHCENDFAAEANPTPGLPNQTFIDYGLAETNIDFETEPPLLTTQINNYSLTDNDTITISLQVFFGSDLTQEFDIQPISAGSQIDFSTPLYLPNNEEEQIFIRLELYNDVNPANNSWTCFPENPQFMSLGINEFLYNPGTDNQEWIELFVPNTISPEGQITIEDATGNSVQITMPDACPNYLVLCRDKTLLLNRYPDCPESNIMEVSSLPILNNEGDIILLKDFSEAVLDSVFYIGVTSKKDISLERQVNADSTITWHYCFNSAKGTPGQPNSEAPPPSALETGHIKLMGSPFNPLADESMHLQYNFRDVANTINCYIYALNGSKVHTIASGLSIGSTGELVWNGKDKQGKAFPRGIYVLLVEAKNSSNQYFLRKQLTVVLATK